MKLDVFIVILFLIAVLCYPADGKTWVQASDVKYRTGETVEDIRTADNYYSFKFTPTSDDYTYKMNIKGYRILFNIYAARGAEATAVIMCMYNAGHVTAHLNDAKTFAGSTIYITPSYVSATEIDIRITNCNGNTVFVERRIIE